MNSQLFSKKLKLFSLLKMGLYQLSLLFLVYLILYNHISYETGFYFVFWANTTIYLGEQLLFDERQTISILERLSGLFFSALILVAYILSKIDLISLSITEYQWWVAGAIVLFMLYPTALFFKQRLVHGRKPKEPIK